MATLTEIVPPLGIQERGVQPGLANQVEQELQIKLSDLRIAQAEVQQRFLTIITSFQNFNPLLSKLKVEEQLCSTQAQKISALEAEVREKKQKITELEQRDQRKTSEMRSLADHLLSVTQKYQTEQSNLGTLKSVCSDWQSMYSRLQKEIGEVEDRLARQKRETTDVQTRYEVRLASQRDTSNDKIGGLKKELADLKHDIKRERDRRSDLETTMEKLKVGIKIREDDSERELKELHTRLRDAERARDDAEREIYKLRNRLDTESARSHSTADLCERMASERDDIRTQIKALETFVREEFPTIGIDSNDPGGDEGCKEADRISKLGVCLKEIFQELRSSREQVLTQHRILTKRIRSQLKESEAFCSKGRRRQRTLRRQVVAYANRCQELQKSENELSCKWRSDRDVIEKKLPELERSIEEAKAWEQKSRGIFTEIEEKTRGLEEKTSRVIEEAHLSVLRLQLRSSAKLYSIRHRHESEIKVKNQKIATLNSVVDAQTQLLDKFTGPSKESKIVADNPITRTEREKATGLMIRLPNPNSLRARQEGSTSSENTPTKSGDVPRISTSAAFTTSSLASTGYPEVVMILDQLKQTNSVHAIRSPISNAGTLNETFYVTSTSHPSDSSAQTGKCAHDKGVSTLESDPSPTTQSIPSISQGLTAPGRTPSGVGSSISMKPTGSHEERLKAVEARLRTAEKRLRDAVIENIELKDKIEVVDDLEESLRSTKKQLKSMEDKLRAAIDENSDLRKRMYE
ncbi:hypothetical protein CPB86DRAFT_878015 [Serendipita vermifera]|nr:hypothetical protein CPB86DRAFT_878015 [Serendipita vermifera]